MKELAVYFKKRMKEQDSIPKLWNDKNFTEDVDYNIDHEIENRKQIIISQIEKNRNINPNQGIQANQEERLKANANNLIDETADDNDFEIDSFLNSKKNNLMEYELKLLKAYNLQKKIRREVVFNFVNEFDRHNTIFYSDILFQKTLLDRRFYKKQVPSILNKKENRLSDKFEQQLKIGIDFRKRDKHIEFLNNVMQHHKEFMEFHKGKKVKFFFKIQNKIF
jgi:hypothetical protein